MQGSPLSRPRVIIADDCERVAEQCFKLLDPKFEVVSIVSGGSELIEATSRFQPDAVVLDVAMPYLNGLLAAERIHEMQPAVKLIFLTASPNPQFAVEAFRRGASAYVVKHRMASELVLAVSRALRGKPFLSPLVREQALPSAKK